MKTVDRCWCVLFWRRHQISHCKLASLHLETVQQVGMLRISSICVFLICRLTFPSVGGEDFTAVSETLTFADQSNREWLSVNIVDDPTVENMEDFSVTLMSTNPRVIITSPSEALIHVVDNDGKHGYNSTGKLI